ncbi:HupE/UreJ family protein [Pontibacter sp. JAM-7]|uniref:HupE/UreJ family protein n=1 Tax=Pontibacter sp. JAM-7 TaxID=3366581 RepID=UPI003AF42F9C
MKYGLYLLLFLLTSQAQAHFTHFEPRILHIYQDQQDVMVLMRMPLPLVLLDDSWGGIDANSSVEYTRQIQTENGTDYLLDLPRLTNTPDELLRRIQQGYQFNINGKQQAASIEAIHLFNSDDRRPFVDISSAESNFSSAISIEDNVVKMFDTGIDIRFRLEGTSLITDDLTIFSALGDKFKAINRLANVVNIYRNDNRQSQTTVGILDISSQHMPSALQRGAKGFWEGLVHIFIGLDHVLFILLIFFTSNSIIRLITLATAFTIGHSFSLLVGENISINSSLFIPGIELLIALSITLTAIALLMDKGHHLNSTPMLCIGFIHGFGFSFVFRELEQAGGQSDWLTLGTFTLGIEAGQLMIYLLAFCLTWLIHHYAPPKRQLGFYVSILALIVSQYWVVTRVMPIIEAVT